MQIAERENRFRLREYQPGDEAQILDGLNRAFGTQWTEEEWRWKYLLGPAGPALIQVATDEKRIVGHWAVLPTLLSVGGVPLKAGQSVDFYLDRDVRFPGYFLEMTHALESRCRSTGLKAVFNFPNRYSLAEVNLGYQRLGIYSTYVKRLNIPDSLRRTALARAVSPALDLFYLMVRHLETRCNGTLLRMRLGAPFEFEASSRLPEDYDSFWRQVREQEPVSLWKDSGYLTWRYLRQPHAVFQFYTLRSAGEPAAFAIVREQPGGQATVMEFLVDNRNVLLGRLLATHLERDAIRRGARRVFYGALDAGFFRQVFQRYSQGLSLNVTPYLKIFADGPLRETLAHSEHWSMAMGDGDAN